MKEVLFEDLSSEIKQTFFKAEVDIVLEIIEKAGLLLEFGRFVESEDAFNVKSFDEVCIEFAMRYPEKLHIISEENRYDMIFIKEES